VISLLLSLWLILLDPIINRDAIIYLRTADAYLRDGLLASFAIFDRPFLSITMAVLHQLTGLSLLHCGLLLSALFYAMLSTAFVSIVRLLGGDRRVQIIAAIVILSHPLIATGRDSIMRDPPYWAFSLLAFRALLLYVRQPILKYQLQWFIFIGFASFFRFEGVFFAVLAPLAVFIAGERTHRLRLSLHLLAFPVAAITLLGITTLFVQTTLLPGSQLFPDLGRYVGKLVALPQTFAEISTRTGEALLFFSAKEDGSTAAIAGLAAVLVLHLCRAIMWPYIIVLVWGRKQNLHKVILDQPRSLLNSHLIIGLIYLSLFILTNRFMLERYAHIFTIFVALYLPFILNAALAPDRKPITKALAILILVGMSIDVSGSLGNRKIYLKEASHWLISNTHEDATIVSNSKYVAYFSHRETDWRKLAGFSFRPEDLGKRPALWREADYIVVQIKPGEFDQWSAFLEKNSMTELQTFTGGRHGKIGIVKVPPQPQPGGGRQN
jgi:hypothetical protein